MSHTNQTGVTGKMQNLKISFDQINLSKKKFKKEKNQARNLCIPTSRPGAKQATEPW
jgi:hypothetical protein